MNCTNRTFTTPKDYLVYINVAASGIIAFFAIFGNMIIITIFLKFRELQNLNNAAITVLALSDFSRGVIVMTTKIYNQIRYAGVVIITGWPKLGEPLCTLTAIVCGFTFVFSPMILALIAVIRYLILLPQNVRRNKMTVRKLIISVGVLFSIALLFATLPLMNIGTYQYSQSHGVCFTNWCNYNSTFRTIFYILVMGISWPILTVCYAALYIALRKYNNGFIRLVDEPHDVYNTQIRSRTDICYDNVNNVSTHNEELLDDYEEQHGVPKDVFNSKSQEEIPRENRSSSNSRISERILKQEKRITQVMLIIFVAYCICWIPAAVVNIIAIDSIDNVPEEWFYIIVTMVELKCAIDPILYGLGNQNYMEAFKKLMRFQ